MGGALIGGASGAAIGGDAAGAIIGTVAGAVLGNAVERGATRGSGFAYDVRMQRDGRVLEVVQPDQYPIAGRLSGLCELRARAYESFPANSVAAPTSAAAAPTSTSAASHANN